MKFLLCLSILLILISIQGQGHCVTVTGKGEANPTADKKILPTLKSLKFGKRNLPKSKRIYIDKNYNIRVVCSLTKEGNNKYCKTVINMKDGQLPPDIDYRPQSLARWRRRYKLKNKVSVKVLATLQIDKSKTRNKADLPQNPTASISTSVASTSLTAKTTTTTTLPRNNYTTRKNKKRLRFG